MGAQCDSAAGKTKTPDPFVFVRWSSRRESPRPRCIPQPASSPNPSRQERKKAGSSKDPAESVFRSLEGTNRAGSRDQKPRSRGSAMSKRQGGPRRCPSRGTQSRLLRRGRRGGGRLWGRGSRSRSGIRLRRFVLLHLGGRFTGRGGASGRFAGLRAARLRTAGPNTAALRAAGLRRAGGRLAGGRGTSDGLADLRSTGSRLAGLRLASLRLAGRRTAGQQPATLRTASLRRAGGRLASSRFASGRLAGLRPAGEQPDAATGLRRTGGRSAGRRGTGCRSTGRRGTSAAGHRKGGAAQKDKTQHRQHGDTDQIRAIHSRILQLITGTVA